MINVTLNLNKTILFWIYNTTFIFSAFKYDKN